MTEITSKPFFQTETDEAVLFTLKNTKGMEVDISSFGAVIVAIRVPDCQGEVADVVLGYDDYEGSRSRKYFLGAAIGRYANRMKDASFTLNGKTYQLEKNEGNNHLHGGFAGFDVKLWQAAVVESRYGQDLRLSYTSPDGEGAYPGTLNVKITYSLSEQNELIIHYDAVSDQDTLCNLTNHSYFNLAGHGSGDILSQELKIYASHFTEIDKESIPTGRVLPVENTPMDFREFRPVGQRIGEDFEQLKLAGGYDHNFVLDHAPGEMGLCAELRDPKSGRRMVCLTDCPGVQFYSGNYLDGTQQGKNGVYYGPRAALCLETQFAPDAVHHPEWDSPILKAGLRYDHTTIYRFEIDE
ncbi:MAG: galactose mutarotase [Oscillospiraceae bacterium]|nr:galactose mutarotase [Oscillospiraceae bacterium]